MGYYTRFDISNNDEDVKNALNDVSGYGDVECISIHWYDFVNDALEVSLMFPDKVVEIAGEGEEARDIWTLYVKNGKSQYEKAQIIVAPFDEDKLI